MTVFQAFRAAWARRHLEVPVFIIMRLLSLAILAPLAAFAVQLAVSLSGQSALTDQDIAWFLLSPAGFLAFLGAASVVLIGSVIAFAVMTIDLRSPSSSRVAAIRLALGQILACLPSLLSYAIQLVVRLLALALPFILAALAVAKGMISEFDINFYLDHRPPEFIAAAAIIGVLVTVMVVVIARALLGWALSLHCVLLGGVPPHISFSASRARMHGQRLRLLWQAACWLAIRAGLVITVAAIFSWALETLPGLFEDRFRLVLTLALVLGGLWTLAALVVSAVSMGALAHLLSAYYGERVIPQALATTPVPKIAGRYVLAGVVALIVGGFLLGDMLIEKVEAPDDVVIIAHRGAAGARPENTLAAVQQAVDDGADWVEIDVQETADGQVVVIHDSDFMKLAGVDLKIWDATMPALTDIDIGSWFDPAYADQRTPTLAQVLELTRDKAQLLIELKYYGHDVDLENRTIAIVEGAGMADQVATMSLKYPAVQKMKQLRPDWRTGVLAATAVGNLTGLDGEFIAVNAGMATPSLVRATDTVGKDLFVWTVNDPVQMSAMISMGVDGLITDEPALARLVLDLRAELGPSARMVLYLAHRMGITVSNEEYRDDNP